MTKVDDAFFINRKKSKIKNIPTLTNIFFNFESVVTEINAVNQTGK